MENKTAEDAWDLLGDEEKCEERIQTLANSLSHMHLYYNNLVSGDPHRHFLDYFKDAYLPDKAINISSFGSGGGHLEQTLIDFRYNYSNIVGYEINPHLVEICNANAKKLGVTGLTYIVQDLNIPSFPKDKYDLGIFFHSLHHVENLEVCLKAVKESLVDDGLLLVIDFVGPNRHQWTQTQMSFAQALLDTLPKKYRYMGNSIKSSISMSTVEEIIAADPSEAPCSEEILEALDNTFTKVEVKPLGGTILQLLFDGIAQNFDENDPDVVKLIQKFQGLEHYLIKNNFVTTDYIFGVYSK